MKKQLVYLSMLLSLAALPLCGNTPEQQTKDAAAAQQTSGQQADAPDILFAKQLQDYLKKNDMDGALASFETMPESLKKDTSLQILHASLLISAGRTKEAADIGNELQAADGRNIEVLELNAQIAAAQGDKDRKNALIRQILAADPYNASANIQQAEEFALNRKFKLAYDYYKKALKNDPENSDALFGCAQMAYYLDNLNEARDTLQKILDKDSSNAAALAYMGKLAAENENYLRATKYIQQAIQNDPSNYSYYLDLGTYQKNQELYADAEKTWTKAISLQPDYFLAYAYRAGLYNEEKKYTESLADYYTVIEKNPQYYYAFEEMGMLEWHEKHWEKARAAFQKALAISKDDYAYELMIAATYLKEKNTIECKKFLQGVMKNMDRTTVEYNMLRLYYDQGGINAENTLRTSIDKIDKSNKRGKMWYYMGLYYELKGYPQIAADYYTKISNMQAPMFFEYELAEWGLGK